MPHHILIAYASRYGTTAEIAQSIAATLRDEGALVDVRSITESIDLSPYTAAILGSAIYRGQWPAEIVAYVTQHQQALAQIPVGLFTVGLMMRKPSEDARYKAQAAMAPVRSLIKEVDVASFAGCCRNLPQPWKALFSLLGAGGDYRDWDAIKRWARGFLQKLPHALDRAA